MKLIFLTGNENKLREIREIMTGLHVEILSAKEAGLSTDIDENGTTFAENALIKVRAMTLRPGVIFMADDSGLSIKALDGAPGIYSSRFLGVDTPYTVKNQYLIDRLKGLSGKERKAWYTCAVAMRFPDGREEVTEGRMYGEIAKTPAGENGFGYDPVFYLPGKGRTAAELSEEEKNAVSHRGKALRKALKILRKALS